MKSIYTAIWNISEYTGIGLGDYGPFVFERMIGAKGVKIYKSNKERVADELKPKYDKLRRKKMFISYMQQALLNIGFLIVYLSIGAFFIFLLSFA